MQFNIYTSNVRDACHPLVRRNKLKQSKKKGEGTYKIYKERYKVVLI